MIHVVDVLGWVGLTDKGESLRLRVEAPSGVKSGEFPWCDDQTPLGGEFINLHIYLSELVIFLVPRAPATSPSQLYED